MNSRFDLRFQWRVRLRALKDRSRPRDARHRPERREAVDVNSVEGFNSRVSRAIAGVFHHISPQHADLYFRE